MMVPEIGELLAATLILGWAFAESVYDVKELLAGEKIPLLKQMLPGITDFLPHYRENCPGLPKRMPPVPIHREWDMKII